mmetsp:Transcript_49899/g.126899  ORF Transcript_49899/g.126899 Transcript_49899/m.126899 type:complete len:203 (+) Transcript_49899:21-629(+)
MGRPDKMYSAEPGARLGSLVRNTVGRSVSVRRGPNWPTTSGLHSAQQHHLNDILRRGARRRSQLRRQHVLVAAAGGARGAVLRPVVEVGLAHRARQGLNEPGAQAGLVEDVPAVQLEYLLPCAILLQAQAAFLVPVLLPRGGIAPRRAGLPGQHLRSPHLQLLLRRPPALLVLSAPLAQAARAQGFEDHLVLRHRSEHLHQT